MLYLLNPNYLNPKYTEYNNMSDEAENKSFMNNTIGQDKIQDLNLDS